jgi:hypothetical protein
MEGNVASGGTVGRCCSAVRVRRFAYYTAHTFIWLRDDWLFSLLKLPG